MKKFLKIAFCVLAVFTLIFIGLSVAKVMFYGDIRDYYPYGLWVTARKLETIPDSYVEIENDTYIAQAITTGNQTWVHEQQSEFVNKGLPQNILWLQDGNYYEIHCIFVDGTPESWKNLPSPVQTIGILGVGWTVLGTLAVAFKIKSPSLRERVSLS